MNLKLKIALFIGGLLFGTVTIIGTVTIYSIRIKGEEDITSFKEEEIFKARQRLENVVDLAFGIVENAYYSLEDRDQSIEEALKILSQIRFDGSEGYFWITDTNLPYPTMIMHAAKPQNKGKVMSDEKYNVVQDKEGKNLYQERVEQSLADGSAFVDYFMVKPDEEKVYSKLSYSKHFSELGWIISSGIYTDSIDDAILIKREEVSSQLSAVIFKIVGLSVGLLIVGLYIGYRFSNQIVDALINVRDRLSLMSQGKKVEKIEAVRSDEIGEMTNSLNDLVDSSINYTRFAREISKGNLDGERRFQEDNVLGNTLETMRLNLRQVVDETNEALHHAGVEGNLHVQISTEGKRGVWKELSESINNLLNSLAQPIFEVNEIANAMAEGDLSHRLETKGKGDVRRLTDNLNKALDQLNTLIAESVTITENVKYSTSEMLVTGDEMSRSTGEIASATSQMSNGAQSQVQKVDEASQLIEGVLKSSDKMKEKAGAINNAAKKGSEDSQRGGKMLDELKVSISEIMQYTTKSSESIEVLKGRSNEINQVLSVITEIASQTNLLALNAAIEAAQAGDAGRGFAVVAEEIRKLAEDSRKSATQIEQLIIDVQKDTLETAEAMKEMGDRVLSGTTVSSAALEIFNEITDSSNNTLVLSEEIVSATENQLNRIQEVVAIIESVVVIAEQTAAGTEEVASSATELSSGMENYMSKSSDLSDVAGGLKDELSKFSLKA